MDNNRQQKSNFISENKGRGLFYGVIAIATFIIMAVGATFAYFTATTQSMNSAVQTGSTTLQLKYISYGAAWSKNDLIPADTYVVEYSVEEQSDVTNKTNPDEAGVYGKNGNNTLCKDDYGNSICSIYVFQVINTAPSPQTVSINVVSQKNGFSNLNAMAYEVARPTDETALAAYNKIYVAEDEELKKLKNGVNDPVFAKDNLDDRPGAIDVVDGNEALLNESQYEPVYINREGVVKTLLKYVKTDEDGSTSIVPALDRLLVPLKTVQDEALEASKRTTRIADNIEINGGETKTFALVLYIQNTDYDQTEDDAEKNFQGQVVVSSGDGNTGVSGSIGLAVDNKDKLQSSEKNDEESGTDSGTEQDPNETEDPVLDPETGA